MKYFKRNHSLNGMPIEDYWRISPQHEWIQIQLRGNGEIYCLRSRRVYSVPLDAIECTKEDWDAGYNKMMERLKNL